MGKGHVVKDVLSLQGPLSQKYFFDTLQLPGSRKIIQQNTRISFASDTFLKGGSHASDHAVMCSNVQHPKKTVVRYKMSLKPKNGTENCLSSGQIPYTHIARVQCQGATVVIVFEFFTIRKVPFHFQNDFNIVK